MPIPNLSFSHELTKINDKREILLLPTIFYILFYFIYSD